MARGAEERTLPERVVTARRTDHGYVATHSTTGTKTDTPIIEMLQSVSVITRDELEDRGVRNLLEALRYTPGVTVSNFGIDNRGYEWLLLRGFDALSTSSCRDGLPQASFVNSAPLTEIYGLERIEVLRGPSSVLFGQWDTGGVSTASANARRAMPWVRWKLRSEVTTASTRHSISAANWTAATPLRTASLALGSTATTRKNARTLTRTAVFDDEHVDQTTVNTHLLGKLRTGLMDHTLLFGVDWNHAKGSEKGLTSTRTPSLDRLNPIYGQAIPEPDTLAEHFTQQSPDGRATPVLLQAHYRSDRLLLYKLTRIFWLEHVYPAADRNRP